MMLQTVGAQSSFSKKESPSRSPWDRSTRSDVGERSGPPPPMGNRPDTRCLGKMLSIQGEQNEEAVVVLRRNFQTGPVEL